VISCEPNLLHGLAFRVTLCVVIGLSFVDQHSFAADRLSLDLPANGSESSTVTKPVSPVLPEPAPTIIQTSSTSSFAGGVIVGSCLLCLGVTLGVWVGRRGSQDQSAHIEEFQKITQVFGGLIQWTSGVGQDLATFKRIVDQVTSHLGSDRELVCTPQSNSIHFLEQLQVANTKLQERLSQAEEALRLRAEEAAAFMREARTDDLTGLANRRVFDEELSRRLAEWCRYGRPVSVMMVDVDHFKSVNDKQGHLAGDTVLREIAAILKSAVRKTDLVTRFGGEEFAVLMPESTPGAACQAAERVRKTVQDSPLTYGDKQLYITVSCGAAQFVIGEAINELLDRADQALYAAKSGGRNRAFWHNGKTCQAIGVEESPKSTAPLEIAPLEIAPVKISEDFDQVCSALRQRLQEVCGR